MGVACFRLEYTFCFLEVYCGSGMGIPRLEAGW